MANYQSLMSDIGKGAKEFAERIAGSDYAKIIYPGKTALVNELNQTIANNTKLSSSIIQENVQKPLGSILNSQVGFDVDEANAIAKKIKPKSYETDIDSLRDTLSQKVPNKKDLDELINKLKKVTELSINKEKKQGIQINSIYDKITKYPKAYFMNPDNKIKYTRIATAAASYAGLNIGGRYLSGGTLTTDSYGRKDIAGVPFL